tara:strand:- start:534 stop:794 length:261 start_codon:yes stop_codon:yes gene_type:complete
MSDEEWKDRLDRIQKANKKIISKEKVFQPRNTNNHKSVRSPRSSDTIGSKCDYCGKRVAARNARVSELGQTYCRTCKKWKQGRQYQ